MIVAAAIKTSDGKVWSLPKPKRHNHVFDAIWDGIGLSDTYMGGVYDEMERLRFKDYIRGHVSGFVTDAGQFLDRDASLSHVRACGQKFVAGRMCSATKRPIPDDEIIGGVLTSEDLWDSPWGRGPSMRPHEQ